MAGGQVAGLRWMGSFLADRCVAAFVLLAASSLPPGLVLADTSSPRLRIEAPAAPVSTSAVEWIEVRGQGGARNHGAHAVVIALDVSNSTLEDSGFDLDGDGEPGRTSAPLLQTLVQSPWGKKRVSESKNPDLDDSVLVAELLAAQGLVDRLADENVPVGIVAFDGQAHVMCAPTVDREELDRALEALHDDLASFLGGTNFGAAIKKAVQMLEDESADVRSILLLSDGVPTSMVSPRRAEEDARRYARFARRRKVRLYPFALGEKSDEDLALYEEIAETTGGVMVRLEEPGEVIGRLRAIDLADLESISIQNETTGRAARALRQLPNGAFDGFVDLAPGENRIRIDAELSDGRTEHVLRVVERVEPDDPDAARRALEEILARLAIRQKKMELWAEMEATRRRRKRVDVQIEEPGAAGGKPGVAAEPSP